MRVFYSGGRGSILDVGWDSLDRMPKVRYIHLRIVSYRNDLIALVYMDDQYYAIMLYSLEGDLICDHNSDRGVF